MNAALATPVIDTHVILRDGDKVLLSQRGGPYGYGRWHAPSGKLDAGEPLTAGAARELLEETGVEVDPEHLRLVHVVHHKQDADTEPSPRRRLAHARRRRRRQDRVRDPRPQ